MAVAYGFYVILISGYNVGFYVYGSCLFFAFCAFVRQAGAKRKCCLIAE
jgi:hypothetical protein